MTEQYIRTGDLFFKVYGRTMVVHLFLPRTSSSRKRPYVRLSAEFQGRDTTYAIRIWDQLGHGYRYAGNVFSDEEPRDPERGDPLHRVIVDWWRVAKKYLEDHHIEP